MELPDETALRDREERDDIRRRRNFELHARLAEPLREWYSAVDALEPGRVRWSLPEVPVRGAAVPARQPRIGAELFDALLDALPAR